MENTIKFFKNLEIYSTLASKTFPSDAKTHSGFGGSPKLR